MNMKGFIVYASSVENVVIYLSNVETDVRFLHVIYLTIREYNMIVSTETSVYHMHFNDIYHIKGLGLKCLFV